MHDALNATGRPILFSICDWQDSAAYWAPPLGNSWRTTDDINTGWSSVMRNLLENDAYWEVAGPSQWNDPDMLGHNDRGSSHTNHASPQADPLTFAPHPDLCCVDCSQRWGMG
jgi:alpha-galactosidase